MKKTGVGIVGYGYWGPNLVRNFAEHPRCELVAVCDKLGSRLSGVRARYPKVRCLSSFDELLKDPNVDAVVIATPVSTHFALAKRALTAGKHVLVEKPLATSVKEAQALVDLARKKRRIILAGHTFIYSPPVRKVKQSIDAGELGRLYYMDFSRVNLGLFQPDVNVLWDLGPHDVSIALYWLGRSPLTVRAQATSFVRRRIEEIGYISMEFSGGVFVHAHVSWLAPVKLRRIAVVGSRRMLVYDDTEKEKVKIYNQGVLKNPETFGEFQLSYRSGDIHSPKIDSTEPLSLECEDFIDSIRKGRQPVSNGKFGVEVVRVLEAAQRSLKKGGAAIRLR